MVSLCGRGFDSLQLHYRFALMRSHPREGSFYMKKALVLRAFLYLSNTSYNQVVYLLADFIVVVLANLGNTYLLME